MATALLALGSIIVLRLASPQSPVLRRIKILKTIPRSWLHGPCDHSSIVLSERDRRIEDDREFPRVRGNEKKVSFIPHFARGAVREGGRDCGFNCGMRRVEEGDAKHGKVHTFESSGVKSAYSVARFWTVPFYLRRSHRRRSTSRLWHGPSLMDRMDRSLKKWCSFSSFSHPQISEFWLFNTEWILLSNTQPIGSCLIRLNHLAVA